MPYNGSGTFNGLPPPDYPAVAGTTITAGHFNNVMTDIYGGLTNAMTRDGQGAMTAALNMGNFKINALAAGVADTDAANVKQYVDAITAAINAKFSSGSFTGTLTGCTTSPTVTVKWAKIGNLVIMSIPGVNATSNATTMTLTGGPAALGNSVNWTDSTGMACTPVTLMDNNQATTSSIVGAEDRGVYVNTDGTIVFIKTTASGFTNSSQKGIGYAPIGAVKMGVQFSYLIQ